MSSVERPAAELLQSHGSGSAARPHVPVNVDLEVAKARDELRLGHLADGIARLEVLTAEDAQGATTVSPGSIGSALALLARGYVVSGDVDRARSTHERALPLLDPGASTLTAQQWTDRGIVMRALGNGDEAIASLEAARALQTEPSIETLGFLGLTLRDANRLEEAEEALRAAHALEPDSGVQLALAEVAQALGRPDAAALYEVAVELLVAGDDLDDLSSAVDGLLSLQPNHPSGLAAKGDLLRRRDQNDEAVEVLERAISLRPEDPVSRASLGSILARDPTRLNEALEHLNHAVAIQPNSRFAHYWRMVALLGLDRLDEALQIADTQLPGDAEARKLFSAALMGAGKYEQALGQINAVLGIVPTDRQALETKAEILLALDRPDAAVEPLRQAIRIEPTEFALASLEEALWALGRPDEALQELERVLSAQPKHASALRVKGRLLRRLGRVDDAIEAIELSVSIEPTGLALVQLSDAYRVAERYQEALDVAQRAVDLDPTGVALVQLSDAFRSLDRNQEALDVAQRAVDLDSDNAMAIGTRGQVLRALGKFDEALPDLDRALELRRDQSWIYLEKAGIQESQGKMHDAVRTLEAGAEANPRDTSLLLALAIDQRQVGDLEAAESNIRRAVEVDPELIAARLELGEILLARADYPGALEAVEAVLARDHRHSRATQVKGQVFVVMGRNEEAIPILDEALRLEPEFTWGWGLKAIALASLDRPTEALECVNLALARLPTDPTLLTQKALIHNLGAEYQEAIATLESVDPSSMTSWDDETRRWAAGIRGIAYLSVGRMAEAEEAMRLAVSANAADIWTRLWLAYAILSTGRLDEAGGMLREVIAGAGKPQDLQPTDLANVGWAHRLLGDFDEAASLLVRAVSHDPSLVWAQFDFALALLSSGADSAAVPEYQRGLDLLRRWPDARRRYGLVSVALKDLEEAYSNSWGAQPLQKTPTFERLQVMLRDHLAQIAAERDDRPVALAGSAAASAGATDSR